VIQRAAALSIPLALSLLIGCGGGDTPAPPPATKAATAAARPTAGAKPGAKPGAAKAPVDTGTVAGDSTQLQREVFSYRGAGRDPFLSLMKTADIRPLVADLRLMGVTYDAAYPARSVAVLRDTAQRKRYAVRTGDELGRMKVTEIRDNAVVVTVDEFGVERQVVLPLRRRPEETP
jgi:hypothetical protein